MMQCHEEYPPPGLEEERKRRRTPIKKINGKDGFSPVW